MVARYSPVARWMHFPNLDGMDGVDGVYAVGWRLTDVATDPWTSRFNEFKANHPKAIMGATALIKLALPELLKCQGWSPSRTGLTVALSSSDTKVVPSKPLPTAASVCAPAVGITYLPNLLAKSVHRSLHKCSSAAERTAEITKANYRAAKVSGSLKRILVLDDFATRGDTLTAIASAIKAQTPTIRVIGIALGKSERKSYAAGCGYEISNDHVPREWGDAWDRT
jgi:hypothetical protein